ncbi:MAG: internal scaffolding protein [Microviridae sp.]|nr:MAG: internal scaffolding protein [Microviridae sp.]
MPLFRTAYDCPVIDGLFSSSGDEYSPVYAEDVDERGVACIVKVSEEKIQDKIEACKEQTLIYNILNSFDDGTLLNKAQGVYADLSAMPDNIHDAYQSVRDARIIFNGLSDDIRQRFNYSFDEFIASSFLSDFNDKLKKDTKVCENNTNREVNGVE